MKSRLSSRRRGRKSIVRRSAIPSAPTAHTYGLRNSTFAVSNSVNTFIVTRSCTNLAETVFCRTVSLSAYAGQHFTETTNTLSFAVGERDKYVTITEKAPSASNVAMA